MNNDNTAANRSYIHTKCKKDILPLQESIHIIHHSLFSICLFFLKNYLFLFYVHGCFTCTWICIMYIVPSEARRGHWNPRNWGYKCCETPHECWELNLGPFGRETRTLSLWAIFPAHYLLTINSQILGLGASWQIHLPGPNQEPSSLKEMQIT